MEKQKVVLILIAVACVAVIVSIALFGRQQRVLQAHQPVQPSEETGKMNRKRGTAGSFQNASASIPAPAPKTTKPSTKVTTDIAQPNQTPSTNPRLPDGTMDPAWEDYMSKERERYEAAQLYREQHKLRELDPDKIEPCEVQPALQAASKKHNVPFEILMALMIAESEGMHRNGEHSIEGGYGVMNLKENNLVDTVSEAAEILGVSKDDVFYKQSVNIEAAAALLSRYHEDALASGVSDSEAWYMAVSQYSGRPNPDLASALADETAAWMIRGVDGDLDDGGGHTELAPNPNPIFLPKNWARVGLTPPKAKDDAGKDKAQADAAPAGPAAPRVSPAPGTQAPANQTPSTNPTQSAQPPTPASTQQTQ